jgi:hypothetical protein
MREESAKLQQKVLDTVRRDNERALAKMKSLGLQVIDTPPALTADLEKNAHAVWEELAGKMYTREWLERVKKIVEEYRKSHS